MYFIIIIINLYKIYNLNIQLNKIQINLIYLNLYQILSKYNYIIIFILFYIYKY